jgi:hypothetical protein
MQESKAEIYILNYFWENTLTRKIHLEIWYTIKTVKYCILNTMLALSHELNVHKYIHRFILIELRI